MSFGDELKRLMSEKGFTQQKLADACGVNQTFVGKLLRGDKSRLGADVMMAFCAALDVPLDHFVEYLAPGVTVPPPPITIIARPADADPDDNPELPFAGKVSCGPPGPGTTFDGEWMEVPPEIYADGNYILEAEGLSMVDFGITPGMFVVIKPTEEAANGQDVFAQVDGEFTLKRLVSRRRGGDREVLLMGSKGVAPIRVREGTDAKVLGVVTFSFRRHK